MVFVPTPPRETASPQAQDLANRIASLIADYQRSHPDLGARDVEDALRAVGGGGRRGRGGREQRAAAAAAAGLLAAFVGLGVFLQQGGGVPWPGVGMVTAIVVGLAVVFLLRRRS